MSRRTARRGSGTSITRSATRARSGARRWSAITSSSARRSPPSTTASRRPTAGTSTRTATSAAACSAARASPSRRRAKRPELEPPLRWRPCTSRLPTFESRQLLALEDAGRVAAEAHEQHADGALAADVVEQRAGLVSGPLAAHGGVERRERRLAHHPLAVGADEGHVALADRRPRDVLVALRPAIEPALEARRRQLVAVLGQRSGDELGDVELVDAEPGLARGGSGACGARRAARRAAPRSRGAPGAREPRCSRSRRRSPTPRRRASRRPWRRR